MERDLHGRIIHVHRHIPRPTVLPHTLNDHRPWNLTSSWSNPSRRDDLLRHCHISEKIQETIRRNRRNHTRRLIRPLHSRNPNQTTTRNPNRIGKATRQLASHALEASCPFPKSPTTLSTHLSL